MWLKYLCNKCSNFMTQYLKNTPLKIQMRTTRYNCTGCAGSFMNHSREYEYEWPFFPVTNCLCILPGNIISIGNVWTTVNILSCSYFNFKDCLLFLVFFVLEDLAAKDVSCWTDTSCRGCQQWLRVHVVHLSVDFEEYESGYSVIFIGSDSWRIVSFSANLVPCS